MADLKHTTKRELRAALNAAHDEITRLVQDSRTHQDAGRFLSKELDTATEGLKTANDQIRELQTRAADFELVATGQGEKIVELESIITSLQQQLNQANAALAEFETEGVTLEALANPINLSALRRVLDANDRNEPVFVLRAKDKVAPQVVEWWASEATKAGVTNSRKLGAALQRAAEMRRFQEANGCQIPN